MKKIAIGCGVLLVLGLIVLVIVAIAGGSSSYNRLVRLSQATDGKWAQVQNDYQRRADLIPNLVSTVSGAANFEKSTLTEVTEARASVGRVTIDAKSAPTDAAKLAEFEKAQGQLSTALSHLMVISERYPELHATANFTALQAQLEGTENRITVSRQDFNEAVQAYDTAIKSFPTVFYAGALGFNSKPYFSASTGAEVAPKVQFNFDNTKPGAAPAKP
jgi:LemA protein